VPAGKRDLSAIVHHKYYSVLEDLGINRNFRPSLPALQTLDGVQAAGQSGQAGRNVSNALADSRSKEKTLSVEVYQI